MSSTLLEGGRILVVGAGTRRSDDPRAPLGNGRAIALRAAREGAGVVCADKDATTAEETAAAVREIGVPAQAIVANIRSKDDCDALVEEATAQRLSGVVLNVGIGRGVGLSGTTVEQWDATFATNLRGHFLVVQAVLPRLPEEAAIVFVGSIAGAKPASGSPAYAASKAGLEALCRHVALEGAARRIRANVVSPGLIDTPLGRLASQGDPRRETRLIPLGRQGTAWEVASAVVFLLSQDASYITGQVLTVDGGLTLL